MHNYVGFVIGLVIIGFIIYLFSTSNALPNIFSLHLPFLTPATSTFSKPSPQPVITQPPSSEPQTPAVTPPPGFTVSQLSSYYDKVRISSVTRASSYNDFGNISIYSSTDKNQIDVTGWHVKANRGDVLTIPMGVNNYNPSGFYVESDIYLNSGDYLNIYNSQSPVGFSLRLNECTGYLNNIFNFQPDLPNNCPPIDRSLIYSFSGRCQSFINSLWSCHQPTPNELNSYSASNDAACRSFLDTLNYAGCYNRYKNDVNFLAREWRVFVGPSSNFSFLDSHDHVFLFDRAGLLVDDYVY